MRRVEWTARGLMKVLKHPSFLFPVEHLGILSTCYSFYPLPHQLYQPADLITTSQCNWIVIFVDYIYRLSGGGKKEDVPICQHYSWIREILCMNHGNSNDTALPPWWISILSLREQRTCWEEQLRTSPKHFWQVCMRFSPSQLHTHIGI